MSTNLPPLSSDEHYIAAENAAKKKDPNQVKTILEAFKTKNKKEIEVFFLDAIQNQNEIMLTFILEELKRTPENKALLNIDAIGVPPINILVFDWALTWGYFKIAEILYRYGANPHATKYDEDPPMMAYLYRAQNPNPTGDEARLIVDFLINTLKIDPTQPDIRDPKKTIIESIAIRKNYPEVLKFLEEYKAKKAAEQKLETENANKKKEEELKAKKNKTEEDPSSTPAKKILENPPKTLENPIGKVDKVDPKLTPEDALKKFSESLKKKVDPAVALKDLNDTWEKENFGDSPGDTPIYGAIKLGNLEVVKQLTTLKVDLNQQDCYRITPLILACLYNKTDIINYLLENKADPNSKPIRGCWSLEYALRHKNKIAVEQLLKYGANPNGNDTNSLLFQQVRLHSIEMAKLLIQAGANSYTALMEAIFSGHDEMVNILVKIGAPVNYDINMITPFRGLTITPLMAAAALGHEKSTYVLAHGGARLDEVNDKGNTALIYALKNNKFIAAAILISQGATISPTAQKLIDQSTKWSKEDLDKIKNALKIPAGQTLEEFTKVFSSNKNKTDTSGGDEVSQNLLIKTLNDFEKIKLLPLINNKKLVTEIGHIMGLSGNIKVNSPTICNFNGVIIREPDSVDIKTEGAPSYVSFRLLREELNEYLNTQNKGQDPIWKKTFEPFDLLYKETNETGYNRKQLVEALNRRYNKEPSKPKDLTTISTGWDGHTVSVSFYKDYFIITNRGEGGDQKYGSKIYKIDPQKLSSVNEVFFRSLVDSGNDYESDRFFKIISTVVNLNQEPFAKFPSKGQKHGTCTFANNKSMIEPILFLLKLEEGATNEAAADYARREYKLFTNFTREHEIDKLIQLIKKNQQEEEYLHKKDNKEGKDTKPLTEIKTANNKFLYIELVKAIIKEHHEEPEENLNLIQPLKVKNMEMERAIRLLDSLPESYRETIKKDETLRIPLEKIAGYKAKKMDMAKKEQAKDQKIALETPKTKEEPKETLDLSKLTAAQTQSQLPAQSQTKIELSKTQESKTPLDKESEPKGPKKL